MFVKKLRINIIVAQIYVNDIVFESTLKHMLKNFVELMQIEFEMGMVGDTTFFFSLQIK
jgi:hypothetical protein